MWIWRAWHRLSHDRPWIGGGMGPPSPGRIAWASVIAWADYHAMSPHDVRLLDAGIQAMDEAYIAWWQAEAERNAALSKTGRRA